MNKPTRTAPVPGEPLAGAAPALRVEGLYAGYTDTPVLRGFAMRVGAGESVCLVGPNGAGKSTVLNAIQGLCTVSSGRIEVAGKDVTQLAAHNRLRRARIAYLLQDNAVFGDMTVEENLLLGGYLHPHARDTRAAVDGVFARHPLLADRRRQPARVLSGGERRILEIARALIMKPQVLLVDEPSIGLDARAAAMVFDTLRGLQRRDGRTIIMVEQNLRLGLSFADVGYLMVAGRVVHTASGMELLHSDVLQQHLHLGTALR